MPFLALCTIAMGTLAIVTSIILVPRIGSYWGVVWARLNSLMTPMFVSVKGRKNINKKQSYIVAANHRSNFDIFVIYGWLRIDFKWVMKQELRDVPFLGIACETLDHVFIDRSNPESAIASINAAKEKIVNGTSIMFFPEGTRQDKKMVGKFKKGAFKMAIDLGLPILPVTIKGTDNVLGAMSMRLFPGFAKMIIHEPVNVEGYTDKNLRELSDKVKEIIKSGLEEA